MIRFMHGTQRNTKAYTITLPSMTLYLSYETVVAVEVWPTREEANEGAIPERLIRWGISRTTDKHLREMINYYVRDKFLDADEDGINRLMRKGLIKSGLSLLGDHWAGAWKEAA
jgi:hypothetical protein